MTGQDQSSADDIPKARASLEVEPLGSFHKVPFSYVYKVGDNINEGSFGVVYKAYHVRNPKQTLAVKVVPKVSKKAEESTTYEATIMRALRDVPNVIELIDFYIEDKEMFMVLEYARGGDVFQRLSEKKTYTEKDARDAAFMLLNTVNCIHKSGIVHRDLKPENLLLKDIAHDSEFVLCDFGFAKYLPEDEKKGLKTKCGTPAFTAPEIWEGDKYREKVDCWALGCILFILLGGVLPFGGVEDEGGIEGLEERILDGDYVFHDTFDVVSGSAKRILARFLNPDAKRRWTIQEALDSKWFKEIKGEELKKLNLQRSLCGIRKYSAKNKFKAACHTVRMSIASKVRMKMLSKQKNKQKSMPTTETVQETTSNASSISRDEEQDVERSAPMRTDSMHDHSYAQSYMMQDVIKQGSFGVIYRGYHKSEPNEFVSIKVMEYPMQREAAIHEIAILDDIKGLPNVQKLIDFHMDSDDDESTPSKKIYMIQTYAHGGYLIDELAKQTAYTEHDARCLAQNILQVLKAIHQLGIVHRGLKPANIQLQEASTQDNSNMNTSFDSKFKIVLCNFDFAKRLPAEESSGLVSFCGTPAYMAPEILQGKEYREKVDLWSFGCILFVLLSGRLPFGNQDEIQTLYDHKAMNQRIQKADYSFSDHDMWDVVSESAKELIKNLLQVDPFQRLSASQALESRWFHRDNTKQLRRISLQPSMSHIKRFYDLEQLQNLTVPGLDYQHREKYLSDEDFEKVFNATREEVKTWKQWKIIKCKRQHHLL